MRFVEVPRHSLIVDSAPFAPRIITVNRKTRASFDHQLTFLSRPKHHGRWVFAALVAMAGGLSYVLSQDPPTLAVDTAASSSTEAPKRAAAAAPARKPVEKVEIDYVVKPGDTLGKIFTTLKIGVSNVPALFSAPVARERFKPLKPGDRLTIALEDGVLHSIKRRVGETEVLAINRSGDGFSANVVTTPVEIKTAQVRGTINSSLFVAGRAVGLNPEMVQQLAHVFGSQVDLALDVRPGDRFSIVYEQKYREGAYVGDGRIVAAELVSNGATHRAVRYTSPDGKVDGYFTPEGQSVRGPFLRAPIDFTRVSPQSHTERQPIITTMQEHRGIDYPAPAGTVVKAAADGRIKFVGDNGEYGTTVIIAHGNGRSTLYAHLSGVAPGVDANQRVAQGETIGYVGNTGASTAPHLHYEYRLNGSYTDPDAAPLPTGPSIPAEYLADFQSRSAALLASLAQSGEAIVTASLAR